MRSSAASIGVLCLLSCFGLVFAEDTQPPTPQMAVTIDDLPVAIGSQHSPEQWRQITEGLLSTLVKHGVPAVGFVNESRLEIEGAVDPAKVRGLERWLDTGLELGNHTYSHPDLHRVTLQEWLDDAARGEHLLRPMMAKRDMTLRYFRHPFLHTGLSTEVQDASSTWLADNGYTVSPVTIDNSEWIYGRAYAGAYNSANQSLLAKIGESYIDYMLDVVSYYEGQTQAIVGRPIPQILLIHAYALNADHLDTLLERLEARGYSWISLEEALSDPIYERPIHGYTGSGGITWLHRWAITEDLDRGIFKGEPEVPQWIEELR